MLLGKFFEKLYDFWEFLNFGGIVGKYCKHFKEIFLDLWCLTTCFWPVLKFSKSLEKFEKTTEKLKKRVLKWYQKNFKTV